MNKSTIFYTLTSNPYKKKWRKSYIRAEVLNWPTEETCKEFWWKYRKPKYPSLPNFLNYEEWKNFNWTLYLWIQTGSIWWDIVFTTWPDFVISNKLKIMFEEEWVTWYRLYNVEFPKNIEAPKYWWLIPNWNEVKSFFEDKENWESDRPYIIYPSTWDGKDFVRWLLWVCISEKLKNILEKHKIENIDIEPMIWENYRYI